MAPKDNKKDASAASGGSDVDDTAKPRFDPKPVNVGGESLFDRIYPYRKKIGLFILTGFLIWGVIAIVIYIRDSRHEKATTKMASVLEIGERRIREPGAAADPAGSGANAKDPTFADPKERANALLDALAKQGTSAGGHAYRASLLVQAGKLDDAIAEYKAGQGQTGLDGVLDREGLGLAQEMKAEAEKDAATRQKGLEEALVSFQSMQPDEKGPRRAFALYHQGRILGLLGKTAEAKTVLDQAKALAGSGANGNAELAELIDQRLASLGT